MTNSHIGYISVQEAAEKWNISRRQVQRLLAQQRIPGAIPWGRTYLIPSGAVKPPALVKKKKRQEPWRDDSCQLQQLSQQEKAYLRGEFRTVLDIYSSLGDNPYYKVLGSFLGLAAAVSLDEYSLFSSIRVFLHNVQKGKGYDKMTSQLAQVALTAAAMGMLAPLQVPVWVKKGDVSGLPSQIRVYGMYLHAKYLQSIGAYGDMLTVLHTTLNLIDEEDCSFGTHIYLQVLCALSYHYTGQPEQGKKWLDRAADRALPNGFITPFAENILHFNGQMDRFLELHYKDYLIPIIQQNKKTMAHWIKFHNLFTKENITDLLTPREYQIALLAARDVPYAVIAGQQFISVGRLKNIMQTIYRKLGIHNRKKLASYVLWNQHKPQ